MKETTAKSTPKDVFSYLLSIVTLYVAVISFITLLFQYTNAAFPDVLEPYYYTGIGNIIRNALASIIVVWPVYVLMSWLIGRDMAHFPEKRDIRVRKWLLYLTLFIAAITIIVDLIILIYNFLGGELTIKFLLKVLSVLIITGIVFGYYIWDIRREMGAKSNAPRAFAYTVSVIIVAVIITGFFIVGTPGTQRARRFDEQRIGHLQTIQQEIINYWINKNELPKTLGSLVNNISGFKPPMDPETDAQYEYIIKGPLEFELCAIFKTSSLIEGKKAARKPPYHDPWLENWVHGKERVCFTRTIDSDLYPKSTGVKEPKEIAPIPPRAMPN